MESSGSRTAEHLRHGLVLPINGGAEGSPIPIGVGDVSVLIDGVTCFDDKNRYVCGLGQAMSDYETAGSSADYNIIIAAGDGGRSGSTHNSAGKDGG